LSSLEHFCKHNIVIRRSKWPFVLFEVHRAILRRVGILKLGKYLPKLTITEEEIDLNCLKLKSFPKIISGFFQRYDIAEHSWELIHSEIEKWRDEISRNTPNSQNLGHSSICQGLAAHVRRGDYVLSADHWGLLGVRFYQQELRKYDEICFFGDEQFLESEFASIFPKHKYYGPNQFEAHCAIFQLANHQKIVISNSTFAWWAGFIGLKSGAEVFSPEPWFKYDSMVNRSLLHPEFNLLKAKFHEA
jgi:hypothetical protein